MKALKTFAFLSKPAEPPVEDGRVVELFRSRAELRKQHEELHDTVQRMRDRLKQQEAATQRVQEMFEGLEKRPQRFEVMKADPERLKNYIASRQ